MKLPEDTLYLPIKQVYFDQIIAGTKKEEYREIKEGITANRYLLRASDENGNPIKGQYVRDEEHTEPSKEYYIDDYNNGHFPFKPYPYKKLYLAVGYNKERDTALVEVDGYRFIPNMIRGNLYAFWQIAYHIGNIVEVHRKRCIIY